MYKTNDAVKYLIYITSGDSYTYNVPSTLDIADTFKK